MKNKSIYINTHPQIPEISVVPMRKTLDIQFRNISCPFSSPWGITPTQIVVVTKPPKIQLGDGIAGSVFYRGLTRCRAVKIPPKRIHKPATTTYAIPRKGF
jgi:hypothetical protein